MSGYTTIRITFDDVENPPEQYHREQKEREQDPARWVLETMNEVRTSLERNGVSDCVLWIVPLGMCQADLAVTESESKRVPDVYRTMGMEHEFTEKDIVTSYAKDPRSDVQERIDVYNLCLIDYDAWVWRDERISKFKAREESLK